MSVGTATGFVLLFGTGIVVSIEACPNSSERVFTSNPSWMQLVENIWRRVWKWTDGNFPFLRILAKRYCNVRGSIGFSFPDTRKAEPLLICFCRISAIYSGIGMVLLELSVLGSVRINFVFANPFTHWIRWMVFLTVKIRFSKSISFHCKAHSSPMRIPVCQDKRRDHGREVCRAYRWDQYDPWKDRKDSGG